MSKARLGALSLIAILSTFAMLTSSAGAAIKFEWKVKGEKLATGESREFTTTSDGHNFDLSGSVAGVQVLLLSKEVEVAAGARILGGKPGKNEETVIFKNVTADSPTGCVVESEGSPTGTVRTQALLTEIVESEETHEPLILFRPETGTVFASLLLLNKGTEKCLTGTPTLGNVSGTLLAQPLPSLTETLNGDLDFEAPTLNYILSNGTLDKAGLKFAGNAATLTGLALVILNTHEVYGAF